MCEGQERVVSVIRETLEDSNSKFGGRTWVPRSRNRFRRSTVIREGAEEIGKVLFSHESRILTPGGGTISPGGAGPPASPSSGHYHPPTHSPPLVKVSDYNRQRLRSSSPLFPSRFRIFLTFFSRIISGNIREPDFGSIANSRLFSVCHLHVS